LSQVELRGVSKDFGHRGVPALNGVDLKVQSGERFVIVGPSGSGKTTLLRLIAGLESLSEGEIWIDGQPVQNVSPRDRGVGMVFQQPAIYPHLTVRQNLAFGLKARGVGRDELETRVKEVAGWLDLASLLDRKPKALSGGERQRVAIGRVVVTRPKVLLMDEPFSSLDAPLRASTREILLDVHQRMGGTLILVTHDQNEAMAIGDRVAVLRCGTFEGMGEPNELYDHPPSAFVATFLGDPPMNLIPIKNSNEGLVMVEADGSHDVIRIEPIGLKFRADRMWLGVRPGSLKIGPMSDCDWRWPAVVDRVESRGDDLLVRLKVAGNVLTCRIGRSSGSWRAGDRVEVGIDPASVHWFAG
jgi:ABC-type sugar transport system ATPase subunit